MPGVFTFKKDFSNYIYFDKFIFFCNHLNQPTFCFIINFRAFAFSHCHYDYD